MVTILIEYQDFPISFKLPAAQDGRVFVFPVLQTCVGGQVNWADVASEGSARPAYPAPTLTVFKNGTLVQASSKSGASSSSAAILMALACLGLAL